MNHLDPIERRDHLVAALLSACPAAVLLHWGQGAAVLLDTERMERVVVITVLEGAQPADLKQLFAAHVKTVVQGSPGTTFVAVGGGPEAAAALKKAKPFVQQAVMGFYHLDGDGRLAFVAGKPRPDVERAAAAIDLATLVEPGVFANALARGQALAQQERTAIAKLHGRYAVTAALSAACVVLLGLGYLWDGGMHSLALLRMGANRSEALRDGEVYRLFASAFLHGDVIHLGVNMLALWSFGPMLEAILGRRRYLLLYAASALGGSLASAMAGGDRWSVGASGAIWGLMAAGVGLALRPKGLLPASMVAGLRGRAMGPLVINVAYSFRPGVDMLAHLGGGVVGFVLMTTLLTDGLVPLDERQEHADAEHRPGPFGLAMAALAAAAMTASVIAALIIGEPWELSGAPTLRRVPLADTGLTIEVPNGVVGKDESTKPDVKLLSFGSLRELPVAFEIVVTNLERAPRPEEVAELFDELRKQLDESAPPKWTRTAAARQTKLGARPAVLVEHDANANVHVKTYVLVEDTRELLIRGYSTNKRPPAWQGVEEKVAASVARAP